MRILAALFLPFLLAAQSSLVQLQQSPAGHVRNFYIWQYMQQDINASQADAAYCLVDGYSQQIFNAYAKRTDKLAVKEQYRCSKLTLLELAQEQNASCANEAFTLLQAAKLNKSQRENLSRVLQEKYPSKSELLLLMNSDQPAQAALKSSAKNYLKLFNDVGYAYRHAYFNIKLSQDQINALSKEKSFNEAVKYTVTDMQMTKMQEALLTLSPQELSAQSYFFLALNALRFKASNKAMFYLELAQKKACERIDIDKAIFWKHLVSNDQTFLKELLQSSDINIYTLYAHEKLGVEVSNYFTQVPLSDTPSDINLENPYVWSDILHEIRQADAQKTQELLKRYSGSNERVLYAFIYSKAQKYKTHNFIMPYEKTMQNLDNDDKAILYALARQESHFIPTAISRSYALGVMQLMPFLIKALAKENNENFNLEKMFDPHKNIEYALMQLQYLKKYLYHPLFIAYAYNGGIGYTKRHLLDGTFEEGSFEPYLSMELMANTQSREYGKKVLANYVIYKKILGEEVKITSLFEKLTEPSRTDYFRTKALVSTH